MNLNQNPKRPVWRRPTGVLLALTLLLSACSGIVGESWAGLSTDGRYVYVAYKEQVFRIDTNTAPDASNHMHAEWITQATNKPHFYAEPAFSDNAVYVGAYDKGFYAFGRDKGGALTTWSVPITGDKIIGPATVNGNLVYVGMGNKGVRAFNGTNGAPVASYDGTQYGIWAAPFILGDTVYVVSLDHNLYALSLGTLTYKWQVDLGGAAVDSGTFDNGTLYLGTFNGQVVAVDTTGKDPSCKNNTPCVARSFTTQNNAWVWGSPVLANGVLYFGDLNGVLYALDAKTFAVKWTATDNKDNPGGIRGRVAIVTNAKPDHKPDATTLAIVGTEGKYAYAYDVRDGSLVWRSALTTNDKILGDLLVIKNNVIFSTLDENQLIVAINVNNGQFDWQFSLTQEMSTFKPTSQPG